MSAVQSGEEGEGVTDTLQRIHNNLFGIRNLSRQSFGRIHFFPRRYCTVKHEYLSTFALYDRCNTSKSIKSSPLVFVYRNQEWGRKGHAL